MKPWYICVPADSVLHGDPQKNGAPSNSGSSQYGGSTHDVERRLKNVEKLYAADAAFAAYLFDGSLVTWGLARYGGDSSGVQAELQQL